MFSIILLSVVITLSTGVGIFMLVTGKGSWIIAGYNTAKPAEKNKYNSTALTKFFGAVLIAVSALLGVSLVGVCLKNSIIQLVSFISILVLFCFAVIFSNFSKIFKKK